MPTLNIFIFWLIEQKNTSLKFHGVLKKFLSLQIALVESCMFQIVLFLFGIICSSVSPTGIMILINTQ